MNPAGMRISRFRSDPPRLQQYNPARGVGR